MIKKTGLIICIIILFIITSCTKEWKVETVKAIIVGKDYDEAYTEKIKKYKKISGKTKMTYKYKRHPEEWNIEVEYDGLELEIDVTEEEFDKYKVGNTISVILRTGFDKNGKVTSRYLVFNRTL
jgi:hypothetical protein